MTQEPAAIDRGIDRERTVVAFGIALLSAAIVISTAYSRIRADLDWSNYTVGLLATAGLLGISVAALAGVVVPRGVDQSSDLAAWPGAFGSVGAGLMVWVALDDSDNVLYFAGLAIFALSAIGFALSRRGPFTVSAILGLILAAGQLFSDTVGFMESDSGDVHGIWTAVALTVFALVVTAAGWPFATRAVSGVVIGVIAVAGFAVLMQTLAIYGVVAGSFDGSYSDYSSDLPSYDNDVWVILGLALLLIVIWAGCAAVTGQVGFRLLMVAMAVAVTPMAVLALQASHPTWWGVVLAGVGGLMLLGVVIDAARRPADPGVAADAGDLGVGP